MKIILINPPWYSPEPVKFQTSNLGLSYITSFVRERGHTVVAVDSLYELPGMPVEVEPVKFKYQDVYKIGLSYDNIVKQVPKDNDLVGISGPTSNHRIIIKELSAAIKKRYPKMKVLVGGPYPSANPEDIPHLNIDYGIDGESEIVLDKLLSGVAHDKIKGLIYRDKKGKWHFNGKADLPADLDKIPFPARDVFHCNEILDNQNHARIRKGTEIVTKKVRSVPMITSRGCPYNCGFCSVHIMNGKKWRYRSPENVIAEMKELKEKYNVDEVALLDDHLAGDRSRFIRIMDLMIKEKINLQWTLPNGIRVDYLDKEILRKMKKSGCTSLVLGVQNGSQEMLDIMETRLDLKKVEEVVREAKNIGLNMAGFFLVGYPGETRKRFRESLRFCKRLGKKYGISDWRINIVRAYPKTRLDKLCKEKGYYVKKDVENLLYFPGYDSEANIKTLEFDPAEIIWRRNYAKRQLMSVENLIYWNLVYYLERLGIKNAFKKIMPQKLWDAQKKIVFEISKRITR